MKHFLEMDKEEIKVGLMALFLSVAVFSFGMIIGNATGRDNARTQAIKAGVAYWSVDPVTGLTTFNYGVRK